MDMMTVLLLLAGLVLLTFGADVLVKGASSLAGSLGISPLVIGLTVVAFGTSAPEMSVSVSSAFKGSAEIAVGNVVGSNICNVLLILGLSAMAASLVVQKQLVRFDIPLMIYGSFIVFLICTFSFCKLLNSVFCSVDNFLDFLKSYKHKEIELILD